MPMYKKSMIILLLLLAAVTGGTLYGYHTSDDAIELEAMSSVKEEKANTETAGGDIVVYVSGAVNSPQLVSLKEGSRVADAVNKCGGFLPTADTGSVNMAQILTDGAQVRVLEKSTENTSQNSVNGQSGSVSSKEGMVNINQADQKGLESLPGIGPAMAQRIIDYRSSNGSFQTIEDLMKIKGIGKAKFEKIKERIRV